MGLVGVGTGWLVFRGLRALLPRRLALVPVLAGVAGALAVPVTALAFVGLYAVGGTAPIDLSTLTTAMLAWHALIGVGEGLITALVVGSVIALRPDLVHGARPALRERTLEIRTRAA
jgi:cobalt/nickel transport system permease protein